MQSQKMLQLIMDNIPQCVFWKDTASVYLGCNLNFARIVGFDSPKDIVGRTDYDLFSDQQEADFYRASDAKVMETDVPEYHMIQSHLRKDGTKAWLETNKVPLHNAEGYVMGVLGTFEEIRQYGVEYRFLHQDGTYRWVYDQAKLVRDEAGKEVEIVGYWTDITQRKQLEAELRSALEKEKELNELKSRFISMTSHEFRTPLSTILSSAELLEHYRHKWTEEKQLTHLHRIQTAVKHMTEMLNDVLVIAKAEAGKLDFRPTPFDLVEYCLYVVEELQLNVNNQHAITFYSQQKSMPCSMDEKLLGHILSNLLSNAIKYSPTGSNVKFTLTCQAGRAIFEIQDHGIGIPPEDLPCLFESFFRATNVGNIQGTGLGLAIVKKCVDTYQGEISVISEVGLGTTFTVSLPLVIC